MAHDSPINTVHEQAEASFLMYGPAESGIAVVETFGEIEAEYAAVRRGCALLDTPHRSLIEVTGDERIEFLNRMLTQELAHLRPFAATDTFWLNRKGRIDADLRLVHFEERTLLTCDALVAAAAVESLESFVFAEDIAFTNHADRAHVLALHGTTAPVLLAKLAAHTAGPPIADLGQGQACTATIAGHEVIIDRADLCAAPGFTITVLSVEHARVVYEHLVEVGSDPEDGQGLKSGHPYRLRQAGWHAFNTARLEGGTPIFNLDFGPDSLPAETGLIDQRVSFTKGCYLGQEVVARMHALGHPKQTLVALKTKSIDGEHPPEAEQPQTGQPIYKADDAEQAKPIGAITSSTRSPMLGDTSIAFAQVKWGSHEPGTDLIVRTDAGLAVATVQPDLAFIDATG
ncbi:MAG: glycine cleavage T C-terminal barrel domain-containing protein [Planctomycetota bacterium]